MPAAALCALAWLAAADIKEHRVTHLPGLNGTLDMQMWSGYIEVPTGQGQDGTAHVHYWLVMNAANATDAPTVVWQQGGPGGSSLIGLMTENGPVTVNDASFHTSQYEETGVPTLWRNPHSWHNAPANMLYVEHPAPTGFSYCTPSAGAACTWDDSSQAPVNYRFYVSFFDHYPELRNNAFYMTGESYAGVLVPTVALQFLQHRNDTNKALAPWSLRGFMLGNDCPGNRIYTCTPYSGWIGTQVSVDFLFGHGMIKEDTYKKINTACEGHWGTYDAPPEPCKTLLENPVRPVMSEAGDTYAMGGGYFLYDTCAPDLLALGPDGTPRGMTAELPPRDGAAARWGSTGYVPNSGEYACGQEKGAQIWLNLPAVQEALHIKLVEKNEFVFSTGLNYSKTWHSLLDEYNDTLLDEYRVMQFSGDADPCVPYVGTQRWIDSLRIPAAVPWRPWQAPGTMPVTGYATVYARNNFTFATVRDAGHMAPRYKPRQLLYLFRRYLANMPP